MVAHFIVDPFCIFWPLCFVVVYESFLLVCFDVFMGYEDGCEDGKMVGGKSYECCPGC